METSPPVVGLPRMVRDDDSEIFDPAPLSRETCPESPWLLEPPRIATDPAAPFAASPDARRKEPLEARPSVDGELIETVPEDSPFANEAVLPLAMATLPPTPATEASPPSRRMDPPAEMPFPDAS
jgi:hypothetical protein